jgi:hypothetical protein
MERQVRQADRQHRDLGRSERCTRRDDEEKKSTGAADRKQHPRHQAQPAQGEDARDPDQQPRGDHQQQPVEMHPVGDRGQPARAHRS